MCVEHTYLLLFKILVMIFQTSSFDDNAEKLANKYAAEVVISASGLKCLVDQGANLERQWELPVVVKEHTIEGLYLLCHYLQAGFITSYIFPILQGCKFSDICLISDFFTQSSLKIIFKFLFSEHVFSDIMINSDLPNDSLCCFRFFH